MNVIKAINFIAEKHKDQFRRGTGLPYIVHPITVMALIDEYKGDSKNIKILKCAALLHDTLEDTECDFHELEEHFGTMTASIVLELTNNERIIKKLGKKRYIEQKMLGMSRYAFTLKLLDRYANILDNPKEQYIKDTEELLIYLDHNGKFDTARLKQIYTDIRKEL